ncbi:MAG TPA: CRTAC1 family protein [Vicinamibacteria bacterium]|nr:CRTAC1 family protein [Vicinamibacteria bacterium]
MILFAILTFTDVTAQSGISFRHDHGGSGRRYIVETFGGGVLVFDYDADGFPDLLFVNGSPLPGAGRPRRPHALYRNLGDGSFRDVAERTGITGDGYGMGGAAADIDNDGDVDVLLTAFGEDELYINNGDGTFRLAAREPSVLWSTSASFFELDGDGFLDLYVARYLDFTLSNHRECLSPTAGIVAYCHPQEYGGVADVLYRNRGDGTFENVSAASGVARFSEGRGLGVVALDYDDDGDSDLYVANDTTRNYLYRNDEGRLSEIGVEAGVAYNEQGLAEAGMGVDAGDVDRDGRLDLVVTNFDFENNTLYRNLGGGFFFDATSAFGLGAASLTELGFGCDFFDADNDGWLDLVVVNGHILDNIAEIQSNLSFAQPGQLFRNEGGRFRDITASSGAIGTPRVGRGLATLDYDRDGDLDLAIASRGGAAELLRNDGGNERAFVGLRLVGVASNRDGVGARVRLELEDRPWLEELRAGSSYLAQNEMTMYIGLGSAAMAEGVSLRWPSGHVDEIDSLDAGRLYVVKEGVGVLNPSAARAKGVAER